MLTRGTRANAAAAASRAALAGRQLESSLPSRSLCCRARRQTLRSAARARVTSPFTVAAPPSWHPARALPAVLAGLLLWPPPLAAAAPSSFSSSTVRVVDGDTLVVGDARRSRRVRLAGVDAPETKQLCKRGGGEWACGAAATQALTEHLSKRSVHCVVTTGEDRYGRNVALCDVGGADVGKWAVENGWALAYKQYGGKVYADAEAAARTARRGVWSSSEFENPWEWRKERREEAVQARVTRTP